MRIVRTPRFRAELKEFCDFIKRDSPFYANKFKQDLKQAVNDLTIFPFGNRKSKTIKSASARDLIYKKYVIPYFVDLENDTIVILGIYKEKPWDF